jgi:MerR family transcriptional regulator, mercuric resistance operon regulatory protein
MLGMTIANLARAGGVGVETIRYYQRRGLLEVPERCSAAGIARGVRRYGEEVLKRLQFIRSAQAAGFSLEQIAELLALDATQDRARARALAERQIAALDARIAELQHARAALSRLAAECQAGEEGPCPILRAFDGGAHACHHA